MIGSSLAFLRDSDFATSKIGPSKERSSRPLIGSFCLWLFWTAPFLCLTVEAQDAGTVSADAGAALYDAAGSEVSLPAALQPDCKLEIKPTKIQTGELTTLHLACRLKAGTRIAVAKEQDLAPLELLDQRTHPSTDAQTVGFDIDLLALAPGAVEVGPIALHVNGPDGRRYPWSTRDTATLEITSVLGNEPNATPKPERPPVSVIEDDYTLAYVGGALVAALVVILLTLLLSRWWRRRAKSEPPPPPPRPPWETAQQELTRLRLSRQRAFEEGASEQWVDALSDAMRKYLGDRYGFDGLESTSDELLAELQKTQTPDLSLPELSALFGDWDLIKFARMEPDVDQCEQWVQRALGIVTQTTPRERPSPMPATVDKGADTKGDKR